MSENGKRNGVIAGGSAALVVVLGLVFGMVKTVSGPISAEKLRAVLERLARQERDGNPRQVSREGERDHPMRTRKAPAPEHEEGNQRPHTVLG